MKTASSFQKVTEPKVGKMYHVAWAKAGCCWNLISIDGNTCTVRTPKTKKDIKVKIEDLREIKRHSK